MKPNRPWQWCPEPVLLGVCVCACVFISACELFKTHALEEILSLSFSVGGHSREDCHMNKCARSILHLELQKPEPQVSDLQLVSQSSA